jgi:hypothetical protein
VEMCPSSCKLVQMGESLEYLECGDQIGRRCGKDVLAIALQDEVAIKVPWSRCSRSRCCDRGVATFYGYIDPLRLERWFPHFGTFDNQGCGCVEGFWPSEPSPSMESSMEETTKIQQLSSGSGVLTRLGGRVKRASW